MGAHRPRREAARGRGTLTLALPVARVLPLLGLAHLDREFDYLVPDDLDEVAQPGVRVRVRFAGRLVDGFLLERLDHSDHPGKLGRLERVVSAERVLTPEILAVATAVAARYAGTRGDVLRLAIPPRHARVEQEPVGEPTCVSVPPVQWSAYGHGDTFVAALADGRAPRAAWQALPGEDWPRRLAELAAVTAARGPGALLIVPDQRDLDRVLAACSALVGDAAVGLSAGLGPTARYRRWLAVLRGTARVVVGTRSAVFAPVADLGLVAIWDDGDDTYAEPRAPYPHAREVALLRVHEAGAAFVAGGFARTAETQALVESGWAHDLVAPRAVVRERAPRINAPGDSDIALERDAAPGCPAARRRVRGGARGAGHRPAGAGSGAAARLRAVVGVREVPHARAVPALPRATRASVAVGRAELPLVRARGRGIPVPDVRVAGAARAGRRCGTHGGGTGAGVSWSTGTHLRRR